MRAPRIQNPRGDKRRRSDRRGAPEAICLEIRGDPAARRPLKITSNRGKRDRSNYYLLSRLSALRSRGSGARGITRLPKVSALRARERERERRIPSRVIILMLDGNFRPTCGPSACRILSDPTESRRLYYVRWESIAGRIISRETLENARWASFVSRIPTRGGSFLRFWHDRIFRGPE